MCNYLVYSLGGAAVFYTRIIYFFILRNATLFTTALILVIYIHKHSFYYLFSNVSIFVLYTFVLVMYYNSNNYVVKCHEHLWI